MSITSQVPPLSSAQIEELKEFDTPTVSNALELIDPSWDRRTGIMAPHIRAFFPEKKPLIGYATTLLFSTKHPPRSEKLQAEWSDYWRYILSVPEPRVTVGQDMDPAPAVGSLWGEVQTNIHMALGCVGVILEGAVRDLEPMQELDYSCFAREVVVGHAYAHFIEVGCPVEVGHVMVRSGELIHADRHGVLVIPHKATPHLAEVCHKIVDAERRFIGVCRDRSHFSLDRLIEAYDKLSEELGVETLSII